MAHLLRVQPDNVWRRGYVLKGADLAAIDQNSFLAVNGDAGGAWSPTSMLTIGGAGMVAASPWSGDVDINVTANAPLVFGRGTADDVFALGGSHPGRTKGIPTNLFEAYGDFAVSVTQGTQLIAPGNRFISPVRVFGGSRVSTCTLSFFVNQSRTVIPESLTRMRIFAVSASGLVLPMSSTAVGADAQGFVPHAPVASAAAWYASGALQTQTVTCDQNNVVDLASFNYFVEVIDEDGPNAWSSAANTFASVVLIAGNISVIDGRS